MTTMQDKFVLVVNYERAGDDSTDDSDAQDVLDALHIEVDATEVVVNGMLYGFNVVRADVVDGDVAEADVTPT